MSLLKDSSFKDKKVLVFGDVILDQYIWGSNKNDFVLGGAANVAKNIKTMGGNPIIYSVIGNDIYGSILQEKLLNLNIQINNIFIEENRRTTLKVRKLPLGNCLSYEDIENITREHIISLIKRIKIDIPLADAVIISDYAKGFLSDLILQEIILLATLNKKPVIVDPKGSNFQKYKYANILTPNYLEFQDMIKSFSNVSNIKVAADKLLKMTHSEIIILTLAEDGLGIYQQNKPPIYFPSMAQKVVNPIGAGDTFISALALCLTLKMEIIRAVFISNYAASIAVAKPNTSSVHIKELLTAIKD